MSSNFDGHRAGLTSPAGDGVEVDISADDATLPCTRALYLGAGGDVRCQLQSGAELTFRNAVGGVTHPWRVKKIFKTGTTASDIVALW